MCGGDAPFQGLIAMHQVCRSCGYRYERESGYFLGAIYVNYGATSIILIALWFVLEAALDLGRLTHTLIWIAFAVVFPLLFHRHARALWMAFDLWFARPEASDFDGPRGGRE
jgi:uncharacterized protein (DUF983 family)